MPITIGTRISQLIKRSAAIGDTRRVNSPNRHQYGGARGTDISFASGNQINSSGSLAGIPAGACIRVIGSPANSREYRVETSSSGNLTVLPAMLTTESSGAEIFVEIV